MVKVRIAFNLQYYVTYVADLPSPTPEDAEKYVHSGKFDPSNWEMDPSLYEGIWDNIKHQTPKVEALCREEDCYNVAEKHYETAPLAKED